MRVAKDLTPKQLAYAKLLRRQIMAIVAKNHWSKEQFYDYLADWKYGDSLRKLSIEQLICVKHMCEKSQGRNEAPEREIKRSDASKYDKQGKYIHSLMKQAGWTTDRLRNYLIQHYKKSHINVLSVSQKRALIIMFNNYIERRGNER